MEEAEAGALTETDESDQADSLSASPDDELGRLERIIESVLFAAGAPLSLRRLCEILAGPSTKEVQAAIGHLREHYGPGQRGIRLYDVAGGYQLRTARENAEWVRAVFRDKPARLGRATLETLAIVAYKQPVTRVEVEAIRGVDADGVLSTLLSRRLIKIAGRKEAVGRPLLYATTPEFLEAFGLKDLNDLPSLKELGPAPDAEEHDSETTPPETAATAAAPAGECTGAPAEDPQPSGGDVTPACGSADPDGSSAPEWAGGQPAGDQGEPTDGSDHG